MFGHFLILDSFPARIFKRTRPFLLLPPAGHRGVSPLGHFQTLLLTRTNNHTHFTTKAEEHTGTAGVVWSVVHRKLLFLDLKENLEREVKEAKEAAHRRRLQELEEHKRHSWAGGEQVGRESNGPKTHPEEG